MDIGNISIQFDNKETLIKAIDKFGREEMVKRICWLFEESDSKKVDDLFTKFLNDDWVDDRGTPLGQFFWGDL